MARDETKEAYKPYIKQVLNNNGYSVDTWEVENSEYFNISASKPGGAKFSIFVRGSKQKRDPDGGFKILKNNEYTSAIAEARKSNSTAKWLVIWDRTSEGLGHQVTFGDLKVLKDECPTTQVRAKTDGNGNFKVRFEFQVTIP